MGEIEYLAHTRCKPYYPYDLPAGGRWRLAIVPTDPLYWYGVHLDTGELHRIGVVATLDFGKALCMVEALDKCH